MMQLEVILYLLGSLFNIPTNWYWYFNICFCSNAQFLTPRETLDSYRKKNSLQNQYQLRLFWICASVWLVWSPWAGYFKTNFPSFLRIRAPVKSSELRTWILQRQKDTNRSKHEIPARTGRRLEKSAELRSDHSILKRGMEVSSGLGYSNVG